MLEYTAAGELSINHQPVTTTDLESRLRVIYVDRRDKTLYILGAPSLRYKHIISVMDAAKGAGVVRLGIITEGMRKAAGV